jgi:hypothetical protein
MNRFEPEVSETHPLFTHIYPFFTKSPSSFAPIRVNSRLKISLHNPSLPPITDH